MAVSVLYIHHSGVFGGASRSLMELIQAFPKGEVQAHLLTQVGQVPAVFREREIPVIETAGLTQLDHTRYGYYRGLRWLILLREIAYLPFTIAGVIRAKYKWKNIDLIHVNEVTNIVSILLVKLIFRCPIVVHVRSVQQTEGAAWRKKLVRWVLNWANSIIAIDLRVRNSLQDCQQVNIIHNGLNLTSNKYEGKQYLDSFLDQTMTIVFVGSLSMMKGIYELLAAAKLCADKKMNVKFLVVGEAPKEAVGIKSYILNKLGYTSDIKGFCKSFIAENGLEHIVDFSGFTLDIERVYKNADLVCFPSHLNAVGRPVIEAALYGVPSIVAIDDWPDDTITHRETGLCIKEKSSESLFSAIEYFYTQPLEIERMGRNAYDLAQTQFNIKYNAKRVLDLYKQSLGK
jgi:glycosyltransferase involved in cell wall biosynthesis